jgi:alcohol dehydrogenase class IV
LPHALAHSLGGLFKVPHGLANSIVLPHSMKFNLEESADRYALIARVMGLDVRGKSDMEAGQAAIDAIVEFTKQLGIPQRLRDAGVPEEGLIEVAELALSDGAIVYNPTLIFEADQIMEVLKEAY